MTGLIIYVALYYVYSVFEDKVCAARYVVWIREG
jgi:hypothetical protein